MSLIRPLAGLLSSAFLIALSACSGDTSNTLEPAAESGAGTSPSGRSVTRSSLPAGQADAIWHGGTILTMTDAQPRAEAIAVRDGEIMAVGSADELLELAGDGTEIHDLEGHALLPGFVDSHGHAYLIGIQALSANLLPPPDGEGSDIASIQRILEEALATHGDRFERIGLMIGFGYDESQLAEQRPPNRDDLDAISTELPILLVHQSGHLGVLNSAGLTAAGFDASTPDPEGGVIRRRPGSQEPDGVLEETAFFSALLSIMPELNEDGTRAIASAGIEQLTRFGYTTAQEGRASQEISEAWRTMSNAGELPIDIVSYPDVLMDAEYVLETVSRDYDGRFRVAGGKLTIDGSPQGFTAWRDRPYYDPPEGFRADYTGYAAANSDTVFEFVDWAYRHDIQLLTHANGERASDTLISALRTAEAVHGAGDRRPVLIHGQFQREDQVDAFIELGVFPSLFPMHTYYWGDWHRDRTVGPELAEDISPTRWYRQRGSMFGTHHDAPVALPDSMRVLDATVTRRTRSGDVLGPNQRVDVMTALKAMTIWPAYQHFEEDRKGSLEVGKLADFVILSADPTAIDPDTLDELLVLETIKEGERVFSLETP